MITSAKALTPSELQTAIVRDPLIVAPETTVMEAIAQMSGVRTRCETTKTTNEPLDELHLEARSSCVLVVEDGRLLGIFTERDVVRLSAQQCSLKHLVMQAVMTKAVVTLREIDFTDLFFVINLLKQYHIRHLPILDEQGRLVGLVTHESLRQTSRPVDLLRLRLVSEVMTSTVICAAPEQTMLAIAQQMAAHRVSSVMIVQTGGTPDNAYPIPVGILTERDLVQFQALGLNLETCLAQMVMSTPIFAVKPTDSLCAVQQIMGQRLIRRLAVVGEQGQLLGIITQTSLLQAFNPLELYKLAEVLEEKVMQLEAEKVQLLKHRTVELEEQVEARTIALKAQAKREQLVAAVATQIRSSLSLQAILDKTVTQVRQLLDCDRVNIWQFGADWETIAVAESTESSLSLLGERINDTCFKHDQAELYRQGRIRVVSDIYTIDMAECHRNLLIRLQTRAKIMVPLLCGDELWGLLKVAESQHAREWQPEEVELLQALAMQLAIALQQATTHQQLQTELVERRQAEVRLRESEQRYATLTAAAPVGIFRTDADGNSLYINQRCSEMLGLAPEATSGNSWQQALHPDDRAHVIAESMRARQEHRPFQLEYRLLRSDGTVLWVLGQAVAEHDAAGAVTGYVGTITDISEQHAALRERKQAETALIQSEAQSRAILVAIPDFMFRVGADGVYRGFVTANRELDLFPTEFDSTGLAMADILPAEIAARHLHYLKQALRTGALQVYEQQVQIGERLQDEEVRVVKRGEDEALFMIRDISDRKRSETALRKTEKQFREAQRIAHLGNWELDLQKNTLFWSDEVFRIVELDPQQVVASYETFLKAIHPDDQAKVNDAYTRHLRDRTPYNTVHRLLMPDGRIKYVREQCETLYTEGGSPILSQGTVQDITYQREIELERAQAEEDLRRIVEGTAAVTGKAFFVELVRHICETLGVRHAFVSQAKPDGFEILAFWSDGRLQPVSPLSYASAPSCLLSLQHGQCFHSNSLRELYPGNELFETLQAESYMGIGLRNAAGEPIGNLCVLHDRPLARSTWAATLLRIFAARAGSELERYQTAQALADLTVKLEHRVQERTAALRESQQFLQTVLDTFPLAVFWKDRDSVFLGCNQLFAKTSGLPSPLESIGKTDFDLSSTEAEALSYRTDDQQVMAAGTAKLGIEETITLPTGEQRWIETNKIPLRDLAGIVVAMVGTFQDISDRKRAEQTIRQQVERETLLREITQRIRQSLDLQTIFDTACQEIRQVIQSDRVGIFKFDPTSNFNEGAFVAEAVVEGFTSVLALRVHDHCFGEKYSRLYVQGRYAVMEDIYRLEACHTNVLTQFQVRANLVMPLICGDVLWGLLCIHQCATTRRWQQAEIDVTQQIANQLAIAIQQANLFGLLQQELAERQQTEAKLTESNQQLALSNQELGRATRLKDEFLANMSHELRTPLNAILGMSEGLQEDVFGALNERQKKAIATVERSGRHLLELISDILEVSKIAAGKLELNLSTVAVKQLCTTSLSFVKQQAFKKNIQLVMTIPPTELGSIAVDERRVRQVLINLLTNAVKFTPIGGRVTLMVQLETIALNLAERVSLNRSMLSRAVLDSPLGACCQLQDYDLCLSVIDTGIGIATADQPKLFQPFVQLDSSLNRQYEGTGLGLTLVKQIAELHGGTVSLQSELGQGSCFTVRLPYVSTWANGRALEKTHLTPEVTVAATAPIDLSCAIAAAPLILLVEDNEANINTISSYLTAKCYQVLSARSGQEAVALAHARKPDLILMDIQMPGMDGLETMRQLRLDPTMMGIPIVALTALAMAGDRERCLEAGANDYLAKPVKLKQLVALIQQLLETKTNS